LKSYDSDSTRLIVRSMNFNVDCIQFHTNMLYSTGKYSSVWQCVRRHATSS
jgi:hypothetical protein